MLRPPFAFPLIGRLANSRPRVNPSHGYDGYNYTLRSFLQPIQEVEDIEPKNPITQGGSISTYRGVVYERPTQVARQPIRQHRIPAPALPAKSPKRKFDYETFHANETVLKLNIAAIRSGFPEDEKKGLFAAFQAIRETNGINPAKAEQDLKRLSTKITKAVEARQENEGSLQTDIPAISPTSKKQSSSPLQPELEKEFLKSSSMTPSSTTVSRSSTPTPPKRGFWILDAFKKTQREKTLQEFNRQLQDPLSTWEKLIREGQIEQANKVRKQQILPIVRSARKAGDSYGWFNLVKPEERKELQKFRIPLENKDFSDLNLRRLNLSDFHMKGGSLAKANLDEAVIDHTIIENSTNLDNQTFRGAYFIPKSAQSGFACRDFTQIHGQEYEAYLTTHFKTWSPEEQIASLETRKKQKLSAYPNPMEEAQRMREAFKAKQKNKKQPVSQERSEGNKAKKATKQELKLETKILKKLKPTLKRYQKINEKYEPKIQALKAQIKKAALQQTEKETLPKDTGKPSPKQDLPQNAKKLVPKQTTTRHLSLKLPKNVERDVQSEVEKYTAHINKAFDL